jgi:hypothetical protein
VAKWEVALRHPLLGNWEKIHNQLTKCMKTKGSIFFLFFFFFYPSYNSEWRGTSSFTSVFSNHSRAFIDSLWLRFAYNGEVDSCMFIFFFLHKISDRLSVTCIKVWKGVTTMLFLVAIQVGVFGMNTNDDSSCSEYWLLFGGEERRMV